MGRLRGHGPSGSSEAHQVECSAGSSTDKPPTTTPAKKLLSPRVLSPGQVDEKGRLKPTPKVRPLVSKALDSSAAPSTTVHAGDPVLRSAKAVAAEPVFDNSKRSAKKRSREDPPTQSSPAPAKRPTADTQIDNAKTKQKEVKGPSELASSSDLTSDPVKQYNSKRSRFSLEPQRGAAS